MTEPEMRQQVLNWVAEARAAGARQEQICKAIGICSRSVQRWKQSLKDRRPDAGRLKPAHALSDEEKVKVLSVLNQREYASLPPSQIVPKLADKGTYLCSESTMYRILREVDQLKHRGKQSAPRKINPPQSYVATGPNQVWCWDITYLPSQIRGMFYYLYAIEDIYSRKIVMWEVHEQESGECAKALVHKAMMREQCFTNPPVLHSDNGSPMKSQTLLQKLYDLGIERSNSRPGVSNDNAYAESLFKTLKYRPAWPEHGFKDLKEVQEWVHVFVDWYNNEHQHSRIRFVTPQQRHSGMEKEILENRRKVYQEAKQRRPERWSGQIRQWDPMGPVALNPQHLEQAA